MPEIAPDGPTYLDYNATTPVAPRCWGAMGLSAECTAGAVRLSLGPCTSASAVDHAGRALIAAWRRLAR